MEAAGLKSPDLYFTKPTPEDIQKRMQAAEPQQQADVGMQQLQMQMQLANEKARMDGENARRKLEMERELKLAEIQQNGALKEAATEMTLRALRTAADPKNFGILAFLSAHTSAPMAELEAAAGLGRLALAERVNDLVQVGLAGRNIDTDHVQATEAGAALAGLMQSISTETAKKLREQLQTPNLNLQTDSPY